LLGSLAVGFSGSRIADGSSFHLFDLWSAPFDSEPPTGFVWKELTPKSNKAAINPGINTTFLSKSKTIAGYTHIYIPWDSLLFYILLSLFDTHKKVGLIFILQWAGCLYPHVFHKIPCFDPCFFHLMVGYTFFASIFWPKK
jgi:hypothetical protein